MAYRWPADTDFSLWELDVVDRNCPVCGRMMHICDHRYRRFHTLDGPVQMTVKWTPLSRPKNGDPSLHSHQALLALIPGMPTLRPHFSAIDQYFYIQASK
jgi:hypothetical protein